MSEVHEKTWLNSYVVSTMKLQLAGCYETAVFPVKHGTQKVSSDRMLDKRRYETLEEAMKGHQEMVAKWTKYGSN